MFLSSLLHAALMDLMKRGTCSWNAVSFLSNQTKSGLMQQKLVWRFLCDYICNAQQTWKEQFFSVIARIDLLGDIFFLPDSNEYRTAISTLYLLLMTQLPNFGYKDYTYTQKLIYTSWNQRNRRLMAENGHLVYNILLHYYII